MFTSRVYLFAFFAVCALFLLSTTDALKKDKVKVDEIIGEKSIFSKVLGHFKFDELKNNSAAILENAINKQTYKKYLDLFGKPARSATEFERRFKLFATRVKKIAKSKIDYLTGKSSFSLGINQFVDWDIDEIQLGFEKNYDKTDSDVNNIDGEKSSRVYNYFRNRVNFIKNMVGGDHNEPELIENGLDLRRTGCVTKVLNQRNCGSCYAFSAMAVVETSICMDQDLNPTNQPAFHLAPQTLVDCFMTSAQVFGCQGGEGVRTLTYLSNRGFFVKEECYPYKARQNFCSVPFIVDEACFVRTPGKKMLPVIFDHYENGTSKNELAMMSHMRVGPIYASIYVTENFAFYYRGVLKKTDLDTENYSSGGHAMAIVGYGTEADGTKYWLVKNSYGPIWGQGGYFRVERGNDAFRIESAAKAVMFIEKSKYDEEKKKQVYIE